ncbi:amidase signature enzyme [Wilcoxina mikolae CBS 423.85]|nr:amidase signature enzyme [Wilcoxina mikolae CBS 423.85]
MFPWPHFFKRSLPPQPPPEPVARSRSLSTRSLSPPKWHLRSSKVVQLDGVSYYIPPDPIVEIEIEDIHHTYAITIIECPCQLDALFLVSKKDNFLANDDVFAPGFLHKIWVHLVDDEVMPETSIEAEGLLQDWGCELSSFRTSNNRRLPEGPYFATPLGIYHAYRLYPDTHGAFIFATRPTGDPNTYTTLGVAQSEAHGLSIAVPSRHYYKVATKEKPLNGVRIAIKDNLHLRGVRTGGSCRAFHDLYQPRDKSSALVQKLIDCGAIIVGKTKLSEFADAEDPTGDWVDYHCPFNPRGDGYLNPGGSSVGSGAAIAAYEWLHIAIGTDTGGSVRVPAGAQGLLGFRPSTGATSLDGTLVISEHLDVIGHIGREVRLFEEFGRVLLKDCGFESFEKFPSKLLVNRDSFPVESAAAQKLYDKFIKYLEDFLGTTKVNFSTKELWKSEGCSQQSLGNYLEPTLTDLVSYGQYHRYKGFQEDHQAKFGEAPYVNPVTRWRWNRGEHTTRDQFEESLRHQKMYADFFAEHVLSPDSTTGSNALLVSPFNPGNVEYRDVYRPHPKERDIREFGWGFRDAFSSPLAGNPEIIIPIGQIPYNSPVSLKVEYVPVTASIQGAKKSDLMLLNLVRQLLTDERAKSNGFSEAVLTGKYAFVPVPPKP